MIKTAVILAAGLGSRLGNRTKNCPKGFLILDSMPIIEHSIQKIFKAGIEDIIIGTGYRHEMFEELTTRYRNIQCVYNPLFESCGSMQTLYSLKQSITSDFILLESDLIYEKKILSTVAGHKNQNVVLASGFTNSGDEVWVEVNENGTLKQLTKERTRLAHIYGELIGISKISYTAFHKMCSYAEQILPTFPKMDYEQALAGISTDTEFIVHKVNKLAWCEVDNEEHWQRAVEIIYPIIQAHEKGNRLVKKNILLNPGPATTTDSVKYAQIVPDICPREEEFGEVMQYISTELTKFAGSTEEYTTILFAGSGTAAVESIISSVIDRKCLFIIHNGAYGKRICEIAENYQIPYIEFSSPYDQAIDLEKLEASIHHHASRISHLAAVHNETTIGLLNPIKQIGSICRKYGITMIVDAMSSFGAIPIDMKNMNIGFLAASSNKNLQGMAGISFVIADKKKLTPTKEISPRNYYLHLYSQYEYFLRTKQMRFTPPVQILYALKQAIIETKWEGIENRYKRYSDIWEILIKGLTALGLTFIGKAQDHSKIITAINEPEIPAYNFKEMHDYFYERGFTIYPGKFADLSTFRIANIGDLTKRDMENFIWLLEQYLQQISET
nr:2-aminoethylphosphonate--pyruvate transaminase [uncultured Bacillus sp.]